MSSPAVPNQTWLENFCHRNRLSPQPAELCHALFSGQPNPQLDRIDARPDQSPYVWGYFLTALNLAVEADATLNAAQKGLYKRHILRALTVQAGVIADAYSLRSLSYPTYLDDTAFHLLSVIDRYTLTNSAEKTMALTMWKGLVDRLHKADPASAPRHLARCSGLGKTDPSVAAAIGEKEMKYPHMLMASAVGRRFPVVRRKALAKPDV